MSATSQRTQTRTSPFSMRVHTHARCTYTYIPSRMYIMYNVLCYTYWYMYIIYVYVTVCEYVWCIWISIKHEQGRLHVVVGVGPCPFWSSPPLRLPPRSRCVPRHTTPLINYSQRLGELKTTREGHRTRGRWPTFLGQQLRKPTTMIIVIKFGPNVQCCILSGYSGGVDNLSVISVTIAQLIVTSRAFEMRMGTIIVYCYYNIIYYTYIYCIRTHTHTHTLSNDKFTDILLTVDEVLVFFLFVCLQVPLPPSGVRSSWASELENKKAYLITTMQGLDFY